MTVEADPTADDVYIDDLSATYPRGSDFKKEGDNHLRLVKKVLKNSFPDIDGPSYQRDVDPRTFGAVGDGITDDTVALQAALDYADTITNVGSVDIQVAVNLGGKHYLITSTLEGPSTNKGIALKEGTLIAGGTTWGTNVPMYKINRSNSIVKDVSFECNNVASGIYIGAGQSKVHNCIIYHMQDYGVYLPDVSGDSEVLDCSITQWDMSDAEYDDQSNFTAYGIWSQNADCKYSGNTIRWCYIPIFLDQGAGATIDQCHLYNGNSPGYKTYIINATKANPGVFTTYEDHEFVVDRAVMFEYVEGMTELNNVKYYINSVPSSTSFTLKDANGTPLDTSSFSDYDTYSATYSQSGYVITVVTSTTNSFAVGENIYLEFTTGTATSGVYEIVTRDSGTNTITVTSETSVTTSGDAVASDLGTVYGNGFEDTINIRILWGARTIEINDCYLDNGLIEVYNNNTNITDCICLYAPLKCINDKFIVKYANKPDDYELSTQMSGLATMSARLRNGSVPLVTYSDVSISGTYSQVGRLITITTSEWHPFSTYTTKEDDIVRQAVNLTFTGGTAVSGKYYVTERISDTEFTVTASVDATTNGSVVCEQNWLKDFSNLANIQTISSSIIQANACPVIYGSLDGDNITPALIIASPNATSYGAKVCFIDADTTIDDVLTYGPWIRSAGDKLTCRGIEVTLQVSSTLKAFVEEATGHFKPGTTNTQNIGSATNDWNNIYLINSPIITSDETLKTNITSLDAKEKRIGKVLKNLIKTYKWADKVAVEGAAARKHTGIIVQDVIAAFEAEGLDPMEYGIVCYDAWDEHEEDGEIVPAGEKYSIRYTELFAFILGSL